MTCFNLFELFITAPAAPAAPSVPGISQVPDRGLLDCINNCTAQGHCHLGKCVCFPNYGGEDCSERGFAFCRFPMSELRVQTKVASMIATLKDLVVMENASAILDSRVTIAKSVGCPRTAFFNFYFLLSCVFVFLYLRRLRMGMWPW